MNPKLKLPAILLPEDIVARDYVSKQIIYNNTGSLGIYDISLLIFSPHAETVKHCHETDNELMVNLQNETVKICSKGQSHNTQNTQNEYQTYLSVKSYVPFSTDIFDFKNGSFALNSKMFPFSFFEENCIKEMHVVKNQQSLGITGITILTFPQNAILDFGGSQEENTLIVNAGTAEVLIIPKGKNQVISNPSGKYTTYIKVTSRAAFSPNDYEMRKM